MNRRTVFPLIAAVMIILAASACIQEATGPVIIVTATPQPPLGIATQQQDSAEPVTPATPLAPLPQGLIQPTLDAARPVVTPAPIPESYTVQRGDSLSAIAEQFGTTVEQLMELNNIVNAEIISVEQVIALPMLTSVVGPEVKLIPDSELVRSPATGDFDIANYVSALPGFLRGYSDTIDEERVTGSEVIRRVADDYSINPRLLLALLEYRSGWLYSPTPDVATAAYPMGFVRPGYEGLYKQLSWAANRLSEGYYGYRLRGQHSFTFAEGLQVLYAPGINAGTAGVQFFLSRINTYDVWLRDVSLNGFYRTYLDLFGDPFAFTYEPLVPADLTQPVMQLPWLPDELWYYTGGPHGAYAAGSAWAAVDFAPPGDDETVGCFVAPQWVTAVADGVIARSERGFVVLDLDGDGDETTGWTVVYLHLATENRMPAGITVKQGDPIGHASCEGGVSFATHLHIERRYNGEWIPAQCHQCLPGIPNVPFVLGNWTIFGWEGQEYQGYMTRGDEYRQAEQGRDTPINQITW